MPNYKIFILLFSLVIGTLVNAKCLRDIVAVGLSLDSIKYYGTVNNEELTIASNAALGVRTAWVIYCPKKRLELQPYVRVRQYSFSDISAQSYWGGVDDKSFLFSTGIETRSFKKLWGQYFELTSELELRQEIGFSVYFPETVYDDSFIYSEKFLNLKAMGGLRYFAWRKGIRDITILAKAGVLKGLSSKSSMGIIYGASVEYFQKMGSKTSGKLDLYLDYYSQKYGELDISRTELGLRTNIVFRY